MRTRAVPYAATRSRDENGPAMTAPDNAPQPPGPYTARVEEELSSRATPPSWLARHGQRTAVVAAVVLVLAFAGGLTWIVTHGDSTPSAASSPATEAPGPTAPWSPPATTAPPGPTRLDMAQVASTTAADGSTGTVSVTTAAVVGKAIVVTIDLTCTAGQMDYNPWHWTYLAADGVPHEMDIYAKLQAPMRAGTLGAGQKLHAQVAFTGGAGDLHGGQVQYALGFGGTIAYWVIP